ncbi:hypothetical protein [Mycobacterium paraense]|uniref:hypothetical protein n=1 Tax=Mycobacterium paraense TaxID=767916 RepID=UPI00111C14E6|nr:hypothetical protein [Mycobacterium paraense]
MTERCRTCRWYQDLPAADREFFDERVADPLVNVTRLYRAALATGLDISPENFRRHINWHHGNAQPADTHSDSRPPERPSGPTDTPAE